MPLAAMFFAGLALDITVPAFVLSIMAVTNWLVLNGPLPRLGKGKTA